MEKASRRTPGNERRRRVAAVDKDRCTGCGLCVDVCLQRALRLCGLVEVDPRRCDGCGVCLRECPNEALSLLRWAPAPAPVAEAEAE